MSGFSIVAVLLLVGIVLIAGAGGWSTSGASASSHRRDIASRCRAWSGQMIDWLLSLSPVAVCALVGLVVGLRPATVRCGCSAGSPRKRAERPTLQQFRPRTSKSSII